jgi:hypothetical protein
MGPQTATPIREPKVSCAVAPEAPKRKLGMFRTLRCVHAMFETSYKVLPRSHVTQHPPNQPVSFSFSAEN